MSINFSSSFPHIFAEQINRVNEEYQNNLNYIKLLGSIFLKIAGTSTDDTLVLSPDERKTLLEDRSLKIGDFSHDYQDLMTYWETEIFFLYNNSNFNVKNIAEIISHYLLLEKRNVNFFFINGKYYIFKKGADKLNISNVEWTNNCIFTVFEIKKNENGDQLKLSLKNLKFSDLLTVYNSSEVLSHYLKDSPINLMKEFEELFKSLQNANFQDNKTKIKLILLSCILNISLKTKYYQDICHFITNLTVMTPTLKYLLEHLVKDKDSKELKTLLEDKINKLRNPVSFNEASHVAALSRQTILLAEKTSSTGSIDPISKIPSQDENYESIKTLGNLIIKFITSKTISNSELDVLKKSLTKNYENWDILIHKSSLIEQWNQSIIQARRNPIKASLTAETLFDSILQILQRKKGQVLLIDSTPHFLDPQKKVQSLSDFLKEHKSSLTDEWFSFYEINSQGISLNGFYLKNLSENNANNTVTNFALKNLGDSSSSFREIYESFNHHTFLDDQSAVKCILLAHFFKDLLYNTSFDETTKFIEKKINEDKELQLTLLLRILKNLNTIIFIEPSLPKLLCFSSKLQCLSFLIKELSKNEKVNTHSILFNLILIEINSALRNIPVKEISSSLQAANLTNLAPLNLQLTTPQPLSVTQINVEKQMKTFEALQNLVLGSASLSKELCQMVMERGWKFPFLDETKQDFINKLFKPFLENKLGISDDFFKLFCIDTTLKKKSDIPLKDCHLLIKNHIQNTPSLMNESNEDRTLKMLYGEISEQVSFSLVVLKLHELAERTKKVLFPQDEIKTVLVIAQDVNEVTAFVCSGRCHNGLLEGFYEYQETSSSKAVFQNKEISLTSATQFTLDEILILKNKLQEKPEYLSGFLILEQQKPKSNVENEEKTESDGSEKEELPKIDASLKREETTTKKRKKDEFKSSPINELATHAKEIKQSHKKTTAKLVGIQETGYRETGNFIPLDLNAKKPTTQPTKSNPKDGTDLFIRHKGTSRIQEDISNPLDSLKNLNRVVEKAKLQDELFKKIAKKEPLNLFQPKPPNLAQEFIPYISCLKEYQIEIVQYLIEFMKVNKFYPALGLDMGTGKTLIYISIILYLISKNGNKFLITAPKNVVPKIYAAIQKYLWDAHYRIIQGICQEPALLKEFKEEITDYFKKTLFDPLQKSFTSNCFEKNTILPALRNYCQYYRGGKPEESVSTILRNLNTRKKLYDFCFSTAKETITACFEKPESKNRFLTYVNELKNEVLNRKEASFDPRILDLLNFKDLEAFEKTYLSLISKINFQTSDTTLGNILYLLVRLSEGEKIEHPPLKWEGESKQEHLNLLRFHVTQIFSAVKSSDYKKIKKNDSEKFIEVLGHKAATKNISPECGYDTTICDEAQFFHTKETNLSKWLSKMPNVMAVSGTLFENKYAELIQLLAYGKSDFITPDQLTALNNSLISAEKTLTNAIKGKIDENFTENIKTSFFYFLQFAHALRPMIIRLKLQDPKVIKAWGSVPEKVNQVFQRTLSKEASHAIDNVSMSSTKLFKKLNQVTKALVHPSLVNMKKEDAEAELPRLFKEKEEDFFKESPIISSLSSEETGFLRDVIKKGKNAVIIVDKKVTAQAVKIYLDYLTQHPEMTDFNAIESWIFEGDTSDKDREQMIRDFRENSTGKKAKVMILMEEAGGPGTDLQSDNTSHMYDFTNGYNPFKNDQAQARLLRVVNTISKVFSTRFSFGTTIEEHRWEIIRNKRLWESFLLDDKSLDVKFKDWLGILETDVVKIFANKNSTTEVVDENRQKVKGILQRDDLKNCTKEMLEKEYKAFLSTMKKNVSSENVEKNSEIPESKQEVESTRISNNKEESKSPKRIRETLSSQPPAKLDQQKHETKINHRSNHIQKQDAVSKEILFSTHATSSQAFKEPEFPHPYLTQSHTNIQESLMQKRLVDAVSRPTKKQDLKTKQSTKCFKDDFYMIPVNNREEGFSLGVAIRCSNNNSILVPPINALLNNSSAENKSSAKEYLLSWKESNISNLATYQCLTFKHADGNQLICEDQVHSGDKVRLFYSEEKWYVMVFKNPQKIGKSS